jgi:mannose-6-phosphate isomerase-like protein (cupin superfamily)
MPKKTGFDIDIEKATIDNQNYRKVLFTAKNIQLVLMSIKTEVGMETHEKVDQFFRVDKGTGKVTIDGREFTIKNGSAFIIPQGSTHNIVNTGKEPLKLYSIYSPPNHPDGRIQKTEEQAVEEEKIDKAKQKVKEVSDDQHLKEAGFETNPKGWNKTSLQKYMKTFSSKMKGTVKSKGFFDKCVKKVEGRLENPEGFCAALKDEAYGSTGWRGKGKTPQEVKKDVSKAKFKVESDQAINQYLDFISETDGDAIKNEGAPLPNDLINILEYDERPNWIGYCLATYRGTPGTQIKCLQAVKEYAAANPFYQYRVDRYIDAIMNNWENQSEQPYPTQNPDEREINLGMSPEDGYSNMDHLEPGILEQELNEDFLGKLKSKTEQIKVLCAKQHPESRAERKACVKKHKTDFIRKLEKIREEHTQETSGKKTAEPIGTKTEEVPQCPKGFKW